MYLNVPNKTTDCHIAFHQVPGILQEVLVFAFPLLCTSYVRMI